MLNNSIVVCLVLKAIAMFWVVLGSEKHTRKLRRIISKGPIMPWDSRNEQRFGVVMPSPPIIQDPIKDLKTIYTWFFFNPTFTYIYSISIKVWSVKNAVYMDVNALWKTWWKTMVSGNIKHQTYPNPSYLGGTTTLPSPTSIPNQKTIHVIHVHLHQMPCKIS